MPTRRIDELVWAALTDPNFCARLLNGQRREILAQLSLTDAEQQDVMAVRANTLESFAGALCRPLETA
ncbi:MAG: hypothetical protein DRI48_05990 [Chloroflexi bacterium]|nr:MAG: hypothetical protein DRI48_05990 [Chloroflexota bacterium]